MPHRSCRCHAFLPVLAIAVAAGACAQSPGAQSSGARDTAPPSPSGGASAAPAQELAPDSLLHPPAPIVPTPAAMRGLYVNRWAAGGQRMRQLIDLAKTTEINALVIDVKDDRGLMLYRSRIPLAREIGADTVGPMSYARVRALLDTMRAHGIYPIARIVVVKDPLLAEHRPEWAIRRADDSTRAWLDRGGKPWLDPHHAEVWQYSADIAREAVDLGFSEIQLDYVRFPDERRLIRESVFPLAAGRTRAQVIREMLGAMRDTLRPLGVRFTIDVFGLTTSDTTDMGIGQKWEMFVDQADAVLPMMYPSHYAPGSYRLGSPNAEPYAVIDHGLRDALRRTRGIEGAGEIIPWYQDFTLGAPRYGAEQVRAQIEAGYANGLESWILWNPGSRYTLGALRPRGSEGRARPPAAADTDSVATVPPGAAPPRR
ncbi:MAG TPA: putative glycoside hydrolase [Gemmatimonadaceae bacterium]|nr:putative glycoside hydrolase [Gemmatimonadaceae bacterium]